MGLYVTHAFVLFVALRWGVGTVSASCVSDSDALCALSQLAGDAALATACAPSADVCALPGVGCSASGRVASLRLVGANVSGQGALEVVACLSELVSLTLARSAITGAIPQSLLGLQHLQHLDLSGNLLVGGVPDDLAELTVVKLSGNPLGGTLPPSVFLSESLAELACHSTCGDSVVASNEACDDGAHASGDGCSPTCTVERGWRCEGEPSRCHVVCGDGIVGPGETCDDGARVARDGCAYNCTIEKGFYCSGEPSVCSAHCGDGIIASSEQCDTGANASHGCVVCIAIAGWVCTGEPSSCHEVCGNGVVTESERCDDGNVVSGDGCNSTCTVEHGWKCTGARTSTCAHRCGDATIFAPLEACDDGNAAPGDGCAANCSTERGWWCMGEPSNCTRHCGNGVLDADEQCDDHNTQPGDGCNDVCDVEHGWVCTNGTCTTTCGDGLVAAPIEQCDCGPTGCAGCNSTTCRVVAGYSCSGDGPLACVEVCGDGIRTPGEQCDDHNTDNEDGCSSSCTTERGWNCSGSPSTCHATCGDGITAVGAETCDDANANESDGCASCAISKGWSCSGEPSRCSEVCGDGILTPSETCDDGNTSPEPDGCSSDCRTIGRGYSCTHVALERSVCTATCGDNITAIGKETCDDGNAAAGDGCSATCSAERGWTCNTVDEPSVCLHTCGNSQLDAGETCDDGNYVSGDGCDDACHVMHGWDCTVAPLPSNCTHSCGDSVVAEPAETCDDGNGNASDGCDACVETPGWHCEGEPSECTQRCGDGVVTISEACDDGNVEGGDGCSSDCEPEPGWWCRSNSTLEPSVCTKNCGNGVVEPDHSETCDDGNAEAGDGCSPFCQVEHGFSCRTLAGVNGSLCTAHCGDGVVAAPVEKCDDNATDDGDGCSSECEVESGWACEGEPSVCKEVCGDGIVTESEQCDAPVGCTAQCRVVHGWTCTSTPIVHEGECVSACGDGLVAAGAETCDTNGTAAAGCSNCSVVAGWKCDGEPSVCSPVCGDGVLIAEEECDDGNDVSGDGCSSTCAFESGWSCTSTLPTVCNHTCGDGLVAHGAEQCDDGALVTGDGCDASCHVEPGWNCTSEPSVCREVCGNGVVSKHEVCDDSNTVSGDGCSSNCSHIEHGFVCPSTGGPCNATCGDGVVAGPVETCDDGNMASGDGCSSTCQKETGWLCEGEPSGCVPGSRPHAFGVTSASTRGGTVVISGEYFGNLVKDVTVLVGARTCSVVAMNSTTISCAMRTGTGGGIKLTVYVRKVSSNSLTYAYMSPLVRNATSAPIAGGRVTLSGDSFGPDSSLVSVKINGVACTDVAVVSAHEVVACTVAQGRGASLPVAVTVDGLTAVAPSVFNYTYPATFTIADVSVPLGKINLTSMSPETGGSVTFPPVSEGGSEVTIVVPAGAFEGDVSIEVKSVDTWAFILSTTASSGRKRFGGYHLDALDSSGGSVAGSVIGDGLSLTFGGTGKLLKGLEFCVTSASYLEASSASYDVPAVATPDSKGALVLTATASYGGSANATNTSVVCGSTAKSGVFFPAVTAAESAGPAAADKRWALSFIALPFVAAAVVVGALWARMRCHRNTAIQPHELPAQPPLPHESIIPVLKEDSKATAGVAPMVVERPMLSVLSLRELRTGLEEVAASADAGINEVPVVAADAVPSRPHSAPTPSDSGRRAASAKESGGYQSEREEPEIPGTVPVVVVSGDLPAPEAAETASLMRNFFDRFGCKTSGELTRDEFLDFMGQLIGANEGDALHRAFLEQQFRMADKQMKGAVNFDEFLAMYKRVYPALLKLAESTKQALARTKSRRGLSSARRVRSMGPKILADYSLPPAKGGSRRVVLPL
eukprot:m51a1_g5159 hypothetical protein (1839) ;mRNA; f:100789-108596